MISVPGDYVVICYSDNVLESKVKFDITITKDGPYDAGDVLQTIFLIAGCVIIGFTALVGLNHLIKRGKAI